MPLSQDKGIILVVVVIVLLCASWAIREILRTKNIKKIADNLTLSFVGYKELSELTLPQATLFEVGLYPQCINLMEGVYKDSFCWVFGFKCQLGYGDSNRTITQSVFLRSSEREAVSTKFFVKIEDEIIALKSNKNGLFFKKNLGSAALR